MSNSDDQWSWDGVNQPRDAGTPAHPATPNPADPHANRYGPQPGHEGESQGASPYGGGQSYGGYGAQPYGQGHGEQQYGQPYGGAQPYSQQYGPGGQAGGYGPASTIPPQNQTGAPPYPGGGYGTPPPGDASYLDQLTARGGAPGSFSYSSGAFKPGIVALRPLSFGEFFDGSFRAIQHNPQVMFGLSLGVAVALAVVEAIIFGGLAWGLADGAYNLYDPYNSMAGLGALGALSAGSLISLVVSFLATVALNGILVISVTQSVIGRKVAIGEVWRLCRPVLLKLVGLTLLISLLTVGVMLVMVVVFAFLLGSVFATTASANSGGSLVMVLLLLLVFFAATVTVSGLMYVRLGVASPVLVMEHTKITAAIGRSWRLTKGYFWRNLFVLLLGVIIVGAISGIFSLPVAFLLNWAVMAAPSSLWIPVVLTVATSALLSALTTPFLASITALLYVDLRMRKEGLDVELIRAASE